MFRGGPQKSYKWVASDLENTVSKSKGNVKINAWGGISKRGKTTIRLFHENLNSEIYCKILAESLDEIKALVKGKVVLVSDNDPKHRSKATTNFCKENNILILDWPP